MMSLAFGVLDLPLPVRKENIFTVINLENDEPMFESPITIKTYNGIQVFELIKLIAARMGIEYQLIRLSDKTDDIPVELGMKTRLIGERSVWVSISESIPITIHIATQGRPGVTVMDIIIPKNERFIFSELKQVISDKINCPVQYIEFVYPEIVDEGRTVEDEITRDAPAIFTVGVEMEATICAKNSRHVEHYHIFWDTNVGQLRSKIAKRKNVDAYQVKLKSMISNQFVDASDNQRVTSFPDLTLYLDIQDH